FIATSPTIDLHLRARVLQAALKRLGARAVIVTEEDERSLSGEGMNSAWFDALEKKNDAVFLITPIADTPWFRTCLRQADRLLFFPRAERRATRISSVSARARTRGPRCRCCRQKNHHRRVNSGLSTSFSFSTDSTEKPP